MTRLALIPLALAVSCLVASCTPAQVAAGGLAVASSIKDQIAELLCRDAAKARGITEEQALAAACTGVNLLPFKEEAERSLRRARTVQ